MIGRRLLVASSVASLLTLVSVAKAAPAPSCNPASMTPSAASIPANFPGFAYTAQAATANDVHLFTLAKVEVPLTLGPVVGGLLKVKPAALTPGTTYELDFSSFCNYGNYPPQGPIVFMATAEAPLPTRLGEVSGTPTVVLEDFGTTKYTITAAYTLDPEMKPWLSVYQLDVALDGNRVSTKASVDATGTSAHVIGTGWCDAVTAASNAHTIQLRATLPFAPTLDTATVTVSFSCPAPNITTPPKEPLQPPPTSASSSSGNAGGGHAGGCAATPSRTGNGATDLTLFAMALGLASFVRRRTAATRRT